MKKTALEKHITPIAIIIILINFNFFSTRMYPITKKIKSDN